MTMNKSSIFSRNFFPLSFALLFIIGIVWAMIMPVFSGTDENMHVITSYTFFHGDVLPKLTSDPGPGYPNRYKTAIVNVNGLNGSNGGINSFNCFLGSEITSAKCDKTSLSGQYAQNKYYDYVSHEPWLPVILTGLPVSIWPNKFGFYFSRLLTAFFSALLMALALTIAFREKRKFLLIGICLAMTPAAIAMWGVIGTVWLETGLAVLMLVSGLALETCDEEKFDLYKNTFYITSILLVLSQVTSMAPAFLIWFICISKLPINRKKQTINLKTNFKFIVACLLSIFISIYWLLKLSAPVNKESISVLTSKYGTVLYHDPIQIIQINLKLLPSLLSQVIQGQGWIPSNYNGPLVISIAWLLLIFLVCCVCFKMMQIKQKTEFLILTFIIIFLIPIGFAIIEWPLVGYEPGNGQWLNRYEIPLFIIIVISALSALDGKSFVFKRLRISEKYLFPFIACSQIIFFVTVFHRYVMGTSGTWNFLNWNRGWRPPIPSLLLVLTGIGALGFLYVFLEQSVQGNNNKHPEISRENNRVLQFIGIKREMFIVVITLGVLSSSFLFVAVTKNDYIDHTKIFPTQTSLSCMSSARCLAGDAYGEVSFVKGSTNSNWKLITSDVNSISEISCSGTNFCFAANSRGSISFFNGHDWNGWKNVDPHSYVSDGAISGIIALKCISKHFCIYVDVLGKYSIFNGKVWTSQTSLSEKTMLNPVKYYVSCVSQRYCFVAGGDEAHFQFYRVNNGASASISYSDWNSKLTGFSCASTFYCFISTSEGRVTKLRTATGTESSVAFLDTKHQNTYFGGVVDISCGLNQLCLALTSDGKVFSYVSNSWKLLVNSRTFLNEKNIYFLGASNFILWGDLDTFVELNGENGTIRSYYAYSISKDKWIKTK